MPGYILLAYVYVGRFPICIIPSVIHELLGWRDRTCVAALLYDKCVCVHVCVRVCVFVQFFVSG